MKPNTKKKWGIGLAYAFIVVGNLAASNLIVSRVDQDAAVPTAALGQAADRPCIIGKKRGNNNSGWEDNERSIRSFASHPVERVGYSASSSTRSANTVMVLLSTSTTPPSTVTDAVPSLP